jgi:predicted nucleotidyltransferase
MESINLDTADVQDLLRLYHVSSLRLFGSRARDEQTSSSDIDLIVGFSQPVSLLQLVAFERKLSSLLGHNVDLSTEASLSPYLRKRILNDCRVVYAA